MYRSTTTTHNDKSLVFQLVEELTAKSATEEFELVDSEGLQVVNSRNLLAQQSELVGGVSSVRSAQVSDHVLGTIAEFRACEPANIVPREIGDSTRCHDWSPVLSSESVNVTL
mmetsp:Transcript_1993/g.3512  ORF Transcript_1993/g.3512 Transcript_1993/m.3512 type:complete len:113 (+) Transcript_1993:629-967(+)